LLATLQAYEAPGQISIVDADSGLLAATLNVGISPLILIRDSTNELLIVDSSPGSFTSRIYLLDPLDGFTASEVLTIEDRADYKSYFPNMVLSSDDRYLAVKQLSLRDDIAACQGGGDGLLCDNNAFAIVDLDEWAISGAIALPQACGQHSAYPDEIGGFVFVCSTGYVAQFTPAATILAEVDFSDIADSQLQPNMRQPTALMFAAVVDDQFIVYRSDGMMIREDGTAVRAVPEGEFIDEWFLLPGDRFVARFRKPTEGYTVFDLRSFEVIATHYIPLDSIAPAEDGSIWTLSDGVAVLRDAESGEVVSEVQVPVGKNGYLLP
jgi:hypothetical protein